MTYWNNDQYTRALSDADIARWAQKWHDNGLLSWDMFQYIGLLLVVAIPFIFAYWIATMIVISPKYRMMIRTGENGMPIIAFAVAWFIGTAIINDIFFAVFFSGPIWAAFYHFVGVQSAIEIEHTVALFRASAILFGAWS